MNMKKQIVCLLTAILVLLSAIWQTTIAASDKMPITIGIATGYAPYVYLDQQGRYVGFDIELANKIGEEIGHKIIFKDLGSMNTLMLSLQKGKVDCVMWGLSITQGRVAKFDMIHYYGKITDQQPLVFWGKTDNITSLDEMSGKVIIVESGSVQDKFAKCYPKIKLKHLDNAIDMILDLKYARSNAALFDPDLLLRYIKKFPELKIINLQLPKEYIRTGVGIAIRKERNDKLKRKLENGIARLKQQGVIDLLITKWFNKA